MLKGLDPVLGPALLSTLRAMGHGDEIALVDGNYPGEEHARRLVRADGLTVAMGGALDLRDTPRGGLTAVVTLPMAMR